VVSYANKISWILPYNRLPHTLLSYLMKLYRAISYRERQDYKKCKQFRTAKNTLEAKQFFKSETGVFEFIEDSLTGNFSPPYKYMYCIELDEECIAKIEYDEQILVGYKAITIQEQYLRNFNKCVKLAVENVI